jgi:DNA repair photolyase
MIGDWQPAEKEFRLSRKMLEVVLELGFPITLNERSPMVVEDLDIISDISKKSFAAIMFSVSFVDSPKAKKIFEPKSPAVELRLKAMAKFAAAGIMAGIAYMPILPFIADSDEDLELVVKNTRDYGGKFVLAGGLTLSGYQRSRYLVTIARYYPDLSAHYDKLYCGEYAPGAEYWTRIALKVRELCVKYGILDRMPRPMFYENLVSNKKVAERLFLKVYELELEQALSQKIWAYRKAAWAVDELKDDVGQIYKKDGMAGLLALPGVGKSIAAEIEKCLKED